MGVEVGQPILEIHLYMSFIKSLNDPAPQCFHCRVSFHNIFVLLILCYRILNAYFHLIHSKCSVFPMTLRSFNINSLIEDRK